jgi:hypothetical protein
MDKMELPGIRMARTDSCSCQLGGHDARWSWVGNIWNISMALMAVSRVGSSIWFWLHLTSTLIPVVKRPGVPYYRL